MSNTERTYVVRGSLLQACLNLLQDHVPYNALMDSNVIPALMELNSQHPAEAPVVVAAEEVVPVCGAV